MMVPPPLGPGDVDMALPPETRRKIKKLNGFSAQHDVMIHYTITEKCPFRCRGCINALTAAAPHAVDPAAGHRDPVRDGRGIVRLIRDSGKERAVVVFYGGEPMLRPGKMLAVFDSIDHENEPLLFLLTGRQRGTTACAVDEMANFDIGGDGRVHACADLPETRFWHADAAAGFRSQVANPPESGRQKVRHPGEPMETISG